MKGRKPTAALTAAVLLLAAAGILGRFAAEEHGGRALDSLPASCVTTGEGHPVREGQIDVNTATAEELDALPGIGPVKAQAIVDWRTQHGPFRYPEDLIRVRGIGEKTLAQLLERITVGGEQNAENLSGR